MSTKVGNSWSKVVKIDRTDYTILGGETAQFTKNEVPDFWKNEFLTTLLIKHNTKDHGQLPKISERLIENGYQLEREDRSGMTPLMVAIWFSRVKMIPLLLKLGANIDHLTLNGEGVFDMVDTEGQIGNSQAIVYYLLKAGAVPNLRLLAHDNFIGVFADYLALKTYDNIELVGIPNKLKKELPFPEELVDFDKHGTFFQSTDDIRMGLEALRKYTSNKNTVKDSNNRPGELHDNGSFDSNDGSVDRNDDGSVDSNNDGSVDSNDDGGESDTFDYFEKLPYRKRLYRPFNCLDDCREMVPKLQNKVVFNTKIEMDKLEQELRRRRFTMNVEYSPFQLTKVKDIRTLWDIYQLFVYPTGSPYPFKLINVYRINNPKLTTMFAHRSNPSENVLQLWHGTNKENLLSILTNGYRIHGDPGYVTVTDTWYGQGVYFAPESYKSSWYSDQIRDRCQDYYERETTSYVLLNLVDLGEESSIWRVPPRDKLGERVIPEGFTSVYVHGGEEYYSKTGVQRDEVVINRKDRILPVYLVKIGCKFGSFSDIFSEHKGLRQLVDLTKGEIKGRGTSYAGD